jgi:hypothetical protein
MTTIPHPAPRAQKGITLFVALILLVMVTLLAVSSFRVSNTNLKVVSSMQGRGEAVAAAQAAIEQVISSAKFTEDPQTYAVTPIPVDIDGNGSPEYTVRLSPAPKCMRSRPTPTQDLDINNPDDRGCYGTVQIGLAATATRCAETVWEITATTTDEVTSAETTVRQGVGMRVDATDSANSCK